MTVTIIVPCPACQGEGRDIRYGLMYEPGESHAHMGEVDYGMCKACHGSGSLEEQIQPRTLADLEQEDFDMIEAAARKKPIPPDQPASLVLMGYGGYSVWMTPEKAQDFAARLRKRGHRCYIVRRKVRRP